jgi:RHO1 GDP-GTP exchange protein 1/2
MPDKLFASRHEWIEHDRTHRAIYFCSGDCQQTFARQSDFEDHMQNIHPNTFSKSQLPALVKMCQRNLPSDAEAVCQLCLRRLLTVQIQRHLARHLEELSLFALPRAEEGPEEMIGSDKVEARGTDSSQAHPESLSVGSSYQDSVAISVDENIPDTESNPWDTSDPRDTPSAASTHAESGKVEENRSNLLHLNKHLKFSPGEFVDLKLTEENRQILTMANFKKGPTDTAEVLVYLLDHAVLLVRKRTVRKQEELHVYRKPIPLELLVVAEMDQAMPRLGIAKRLLSATNLLRENQAFPVMFRHVGRGGYELPLYATSVTQRQKFIEKVEEQQRLLRERNSNFYTKTTLCEGFFNSNNRVNCLAPMDGGRKLAYGTDSGIYLSDRLPKDKNARPKRVLDAYQVTQVDILEEYQLLLVLSNKILTSYSLEALDPNNEYPQAKLPKKIQSQVNFFKAGVCFGRRLVCSVKTSALSSAIKVYEPADYLAEGRKRPTFRNMLQSGRGDLKLFKVPNPHLLSTKVRSP